MFGKNIFGQFKISLFVFGLYKSPPKVQLFIQTDHTDWLTDGVCHPNGSHWLTDWRCLWARLIPQVCAILILNSICNIKLTTPSARGWQTRQAFRHRLKVTTSESAGFDPSDGNDFSKEEKDKKKIHQSNRLRWLGGHRFDSLLCAIFCRLMVQLFCWIPKPSQDVYLLPLIPLIQQWGSILLVELINGLCDGLTILI